MNEPESFGLPFPGLVAPEADERADDELAGARGVVLGVGGGLLGWIVLTAAVGGFLALVRG